MSFKSLEEFEKAIPATWEEYEEYMLKTKQWRTEDEQYAIEAAISALIEEVPGESYGC